MLGMMSDCEKTKERLIAELEALRAEVAKLKLVHEQPAEQVHLLDRQQDRSSASVLQESEERLRMALEGAKLERWDWDLNSGRIEWSDRCTALFGLADEPEITYEVFLNAVHPDDRAKIMQVAHQAITERQDLNVEYRVLFGDGTVRWLASKGRAFYDPAGNPMRMAGVLMDISESKRQEAERQWAEQALRESERKFRAIFDQTFELLGVLTLDGIVLEANQAALDSIGARRSEIIGKPFWDTPWWSHSAAAQEHLKQAIAQAATGQFIRYETQFPGADGSIITTDFSIQPVFDETGQVVMLIPEGRDIRDRKSVEQALRQVTAALEGRVAERTAELSQANGRLLRELIERQQVEEALRQSEAKFRSLCEASPLGIFMMDTKGRGTYYNPRAQEICGYTEEEALGEGWMRFIHPADLERILAQWSISENRQGSYKDVRFIHKDGTIRYGCMQTAPIFAAGGERIGYVGTIEDITEARAIERMKSEFISVVSHELRTPLTSIRGSLGLLASGIYDNKPEKARRMIDIALTDTDRLVRLVNDILDLERLESGEVSLTKEVCEAADLLQRSIEAMQSIAKSDQVELATAPTTARVWANPDAIIQTLTNLISNAIKFSAPQTTISLSAKCVHYIDAKTGKNQELQEPIDPTGEDMRPMAPPPYVLFAVQDRGRGIPPEKLETIFQRFQQVDASDSRQKGGTGLGLTICQNIVQQHGGHIWAESKVGEGSTFYFTVPVPQEPSPFNPPADSPSEATHVS